jgi:hypothetical protein
MATARIAAIAAIVIAVVYPHRAWAIPLFANGQGPNIVFTVENVSTVGSTPVVNLQLLWAGPWNRAR